MDAERICASLLPGGRILKDEWVCGNVSGEPGDSLHVDLTGPHAGKWRDFANEDEHHGDLMDLYRASRGCSAADSVKWGKDWLGIVPAIPEPPARSYKPAPTRDDIKDPNPAGRAMEFLTKKRGLTPATIARFKIQCDPSAIVFPCYSPAGELVNRSYRTLGEKKKVWQDEGCAPSMFGWHALAEKAYQDRTILICEGQIDCMTWTQWDVPALSIPNGGGQTWIAAEWDNLEIFDRIYISFDMDGAGMTNAQKTIQRLGVHRCVIVNLPHKDANDCLMKGCEAEDAALWIAEAKPPKLKNLMSGNDLEKRLLASMLPQPECFTLPCLKSGKYGDGYFPRPGEVTVWQGVTSHGKSTFLNYFFLVLVGKGDPVFIASMEAKAETILRKMMAGFFNHQPAQSEAKEFLAHVGHNLLFADVVGYIAQEDLFEMMRFSQRRYGVTHFLIDSLMRVDGLEEDYPQQGKFLNSLQEFAKGTGGHVHLVVHPRKIAEGAKPGKMDIKGSSLIANNADNIMTVCKNEEKDKLRRNNELTPMQSAAMYDTEIRVEKQRETGWEGRFLLRFNPIAYSFETFTTPDSEDAKPDRRYGNQS